MLSLVCIAKNEDKRIEKFLSHYEWVDEMVVVDNGSSDKTVEIAKRFTNKVFINREYNLGKLKQFAISKAQCEWILLLDVDEFTSDELREEIRKAIKNPKYETYLVHRQAFWGNKPLVGKYAHEKFIRFFKKGKAEVDLVPVHEKVITKEPFGELAGILNHYTYRSVSQVFKKLIDYAKRQIDLPENLRTKVNIKHFTAYPAHMFWAIFIKDKGYRDGIYGFLLALLFAYSEFAKYYFIWLNKHQTINSQRNKQS